MTNNDNNIGKDPQLNSSSFVQDDKVKNEIDKLIMARLESLMPNKSDKSSPTDKNNQDDKRKLFLDAIGGAVGSLGGAVGGGVSSLASGAGDMLSGGGAGVGIGAAAAGAGLMKKQQREKEHAHKLMMIENEMATSTFSADFQDQAIQELSRAVGRAKYVDGRIYTIDKTLDYSLGHMTVSYTHLTLPTNREV